ncbi:MAG TPA: exodeoxyribonuclease VII small subunit [Candidatus Thermoplasmatota archaeon]|nr:exodeoxyribonuclease VII small subunit [Candidatus Thermoplasmatota archaeon]
MTKKQNTFEESLADLDERVEALESGDLALDEALAAFEEGVKLVARLRADLARVDGRIEELLADGETRSLTPE